MLARRAKNLPGLLAVAAGLALFASQALPVAEAQQYTEEGTERCLLCHAELRMTLIADTPHGDASNPDTPFGQRGCESCHGPGSFHVSRSGGSQGRPKMLVFGENSATPREKQVEVCMGCHVANIDELLKINAHANARGARDMMDLSCSSCHTIHQVPEHMAEQATAESGLLAKKVSQTAEYTSGGSQQCLLCHTEERMHLMAGTVHGNRSNPATPYGQQGCESCHGMGSLHVRALVGGEKRPAMITFGEHASTPAEEQMRTCMSCHRKNQGQMVAVEAHRNAVDFEGVSCATCHTLHPFPETAQEGSGAPGPTARFTERGAEQCLLCHFQEQVVEVRKTPHGDRTNPQAPFAQHECESCHGPGSAHVSQSMRGDGRPPMIQFGRAGHTPLRLQSDTCLACHNKHEDGFADLEWRRMLHRRGGTCSDCHTVHSEVQLLNSTANEISACLACHDKAGGAAPLINWAGSMHANDQVSCRSCHTVHVAGSMLKDLHAQTGNCASCHADADISIGAIAWQDSVHANSELACADCHTVHTEYNVLRDRAAQTEVCYACHADRETEHPRFEDKAIRFDQLNCSTCHDVHQLIPRHQGAGSPPKIAMEQ